MGQTDPPTLSDTINGFAPAATSKTIQSARVLILDRTGTYTSTLNLAFEVRTNAGIIQHTVSAASTDLQVAPIGTWMTISLSSTAANLVVGSGEYLAAHVSTGGVPAGDLSVYPVFEVIVQNSP